ncbi:MAG: hypothetical protein ACI9KE_000259, partial [Polyangiales bacterium]
SAARSRMTVESADVGLSAIMKPSTQTGSELCLGLCRVSFT